MDVPDLVDELPVDLTSIPNATVDQFADAKGLQPNADKPKRRIPLTIITGYLGSGKSTLLEMIGKTSNKKLAIILNEFGDSSVIEKSVTIKDSNNSVQEWLDLGNGCLCCTVKDNGVLAIEQLIENSKDRIDYILLETTGIADPAPIIKMFWLDEALTSNIYVDGIVTVVDSENIVKCLDDTGGHWHKENRHLKVDQVSADVLTEEEIEIEEKALQEGITTAHLQIALADVILINKVDKLSNPDQLKEIESRIGAINQTTPTHTTSFGDIDLDKILDLHAYDSDPIKISKAISGRSTSYHDDRISTISIDFPFFTSEDEFNQVELFLQYVLWENKANNKPIEVQRLKGLLITKHGGTSEVKVVQGVRETYEIVGGGVLLDNVTANKLVFIGKGLLQEDLVVELEKFIGNKKRSAKDIPTGLLS